MSTYTPIASQTTTGTTSTITFNSIPQNYTDLMLITSGTSAGPDYTITAQFNSDTGNNYSSTFFNSSAGSLVTNRDVNSPSVYVGSIDTTQSTSITSIQNYSNTNTYKAVISRGNASTARIRAYAGLWRNTSAITSIIIGTNGSNFNSGCTFNLYGVVKGGGYALGGDIVTTDGTYWYHAFLSSNVFIPTQNLTVDTLVIAGGGAGAGRGFGDNGGGGGGAGGVLYQTSLAATANNNYQVIVGAGGAGAAGAGNRGGNSYIAGLTSNAITGGAGGASGWNIVGGSGSGSDGNTTITVNSGDNSTSGQGNKGGTGATPSASGSGGGGGGGAGSAGANGSGQTGGNGGNGTSSFTSWASATGTGVSNVYAGGGGGSGGSGSAGSGGSGGGGAGRNYASPGNGTSGTANTGSGGGCGNVSSGPATGGNGGSGIVIVRYAV
jgi:hypothetical protein